MMKTSIKREQSQAGLSFAERENRRSLAGGESKFRPQVKNKLLLLLALLLTAATGAWAQSDPDYESSDWSSQEAADAIVGTHGDITISGVFSNPGNVSGHWYNSIASRLQADVTPWDGYLGISSTKQIEKISILYCPHGRNETNLAWIAWGKDVTPNEYCLDHGETNGTTGSNSWDAKVWEDIDLSGSNAYTVYIARSIRHFYETGGTNYISNFGKNQTINVLGIKVWLKSDAGGSGASTPTTVTWDSSVFSGIDLSSGQSFTEGDITLTALNGTVYGPGGSWSPSDDAAYKFSTSSGNFTKIEITGDIMGINGSGWTVTGSSAVWTGDANEITFGGYFEQVSQIVFTIAGAAASGYTVSLNDGAENPTTWTASTDGTNFGALPIGGLKGGETVTLKYNGRLKVKSVTATSDAAPAKEPATVTTAPKGAAVVGVGKETALVSGGVADGGTLMYAVTTTNTKPTSTAGFSDAVPTAKDITASGTVYVWYYVKGDDTHSDSEIAATAIEVPVADIVWDATNVSDLFVYGNAQSSDVKEGVKLSANGGEIYAQWADTGDPTTSGILFELYEPGSFTFTAPTGKAFTKIEMKAQGPDDWATAYTDEKLGTGWSFSGDDTNMIYTVTWKGSAAASTVDLLKGAEFFSGAFVKSIAFYLVDAE